MLIHANGRKRGWMREDVGVAWVVGALSVCVSVGRLKARFDMTMLGIKVEALRRM